MGFNRTEATLKVMRDDLGRIEVYLNSCFSIGPVALYNAFNSASPHLDLARDELRKARLGLDKVLLHSRNLSLSEKETQKIVERLHRSWSKQRRRKRAGSRRKLPKEAEKG